MLRRTLLACAFVAVLPMAAGTKKMTVEDSLAIRQPGDPQLSPDGRWVAYTISEWDKEKNRRVSHIWLVSASGGNSTRLTNGEKGESGPQWAPDGSRIAFLADRSTTPPAEGSGRSGNQIWWIRPTGGEAEKLTSEENGVSSYGWSPDGKSIAYVTRDTPKDKTEREKRKKDKFDAILVDSDLRYAHLWRVDVANGKKQRLTEGEFSVSAPKWSPDGKWIAYVMSKAGQQDSSYTDISNDSRTDIYVVSAGGGAPKRITDNPGADNDPEWSPDGKQLAYLARTDPKSWASKSDVMIVNVDGGTPKDLTKDHFESAANLAWAGGKLFFASQSGVYTHIFAVSPAGGPVERWKGGEKIYNQARFSADGKTMIYVLGSSEQPGDLYLASAASGAETRLTDANPQIADFAIGKTSVIKWKAKDGKDIEGVLVYPVDHRQGQRVPLILQIHGGPYGRFDASFQSRAQIFAGAGYAMLMPNPRGSTGYGINFTTSNVSDWGGRDFEDIMAGVDAVIASGLADADKCVVMGGSYGGFMTFWTITQTNRFKAAIGHAAIADWYSFYGQSDIPGLMEYGFSGMPWASTATYRKYSPMTYIDRVKTPIMITHGEQDRRVPIAQGEQYYRALKMRGVETQFVRYPREGHGIQEPNHQIDLVNRQLDWFAKHLN